MTVSRPHSPCVVGNDAPFARPRRTTRPGTRTLVDNLPSDVRWQAVRRLVCTQMLGFPFIAGHDAPLIDERAATRGPQRDER
jgi:hypothetical protein